MGLISAIHNLIQTLQKFFFPENQEGLLNEIMRLQIYEKGETKLKIKKFICQELMLLEVKATKIQ